MAHAQCEQGVLEIANSAGKARRVKREARLPFEKEKKYVDGASLYVLALHPAMPTTQRCIITAIGIK